MHFCLWNDNMYGLLVTYPQFKYDSVLSWCRYECLFKLNFALNTLPHVLYLNPSVIVPTTYSHWPVLLICFFSFPHFVVLLLLWLCLCQCRFLCSMWRVDAFAGNRHRRLSVAQSFLHSDLCSTAKDMTFESITPRRWELVWHAVHPVQQGFITFQLLVPWDRNLFQLNLCGLITRSNAVISNRTLAFCNAVISNRPLSFCNAVICYLCLVCMVASGTSLLSWSRR